MKGEKTVTTRKDHKCAGCYRTITAGSKVIAWTFLDATGESGWSTWYICPVCEAVKAETKCEDYDGALYEGFAIETDREYWNKRRAEIEKEATNGH